MAEITRAEEVQEMIDVLEQYEYAEGHHYEPTSYGCGEVYDVSTENKRELTDHLKTHPCYNGRNQIVLKETFHRDVDEREMESFIGILRRKRSGCGDYEYKFVEGEIVRVKDIDLAAVDVGWVEPMDYFKGKKVKVLDEDSSGDTVRCVGINQYGKEESWWYSVRDLEHLDGTDYAVKSEMEVFDHVAYCTVRNLIRDGQYISEEMTKAVNDTFPWLCAHSGQKMSRLVKKIVDHFHLGNGESDWNGTWTRFADAVNPLDVDRWTVISWHKVDYLTMSFGNSWASCHTIDKTNLRGMPNSYEGMYSSGTLSYCLDGTSVVVYVIDKNYKGNTPELQPKILRQMFHIAPDGTRFVQGRLYPQNKDCGAKETYDKLRNIMQRVLSECFGYTNYWKVEHGTSVCSSAIISHGTHYRDYECYDNCTLSTHKELDTGVMIEVGHRPICPSCGETHDAEDCVLCPSCASTERCEYCGDAVDFDGGGIRAYDGTVFCCDACAQRAGYVYCWNDEEWHENDYRVFYDNWIEEYCYDRWDEHIVTVDGNEYLDSENANCDGYHYVESKDGWYHEDELELNEDGEYVLREEVA